MWNRVAAWLIASRQLDWNIQTWTNPWYVALLLEWDWFEGTGLLLDNVFPGELDPSWRFKMIGRAFRFADSGLGFPGDGWAGQRMTVSADFGRPFLQTKTSRSSAVAWPTDSCRGNSRSSGASTWASARTDIPIQPLPGEVEPGQDGLGANFRGVLWHGWAVKRR